MPPRRKKFKFRKFAEERQQGLNKKYDRKSEQAGPKYIRRNQPICIPPEVEEKVIIITDGWNVTASIGT